MVYIKKIPTKKEHIGSYRKLCHKVGLELLEYAFLKEYGFSFCEADILKKKHGKPYMEKSPCKFNISHCDGLAVCVLSDSEVGIDAEGIRQILPRVMKRCYSDSEIAYINSYADKDIAFTKLWTLKESYVKFTGEGVSSDLKAICFDLQSGNAFTDTVSFTQLQLNEKYVISVCKGEKAEGITQDTINIEFNNGIIELSI